MMFALIGLVVLQIFTTGIAVYHYKLRGKSSEEIRPFSQLYIGMAALAFGLLMVYLFFFYVSPNFVVGENLGQVGDFVGGLTNPALSFIALIVLLRTTLIQTMEARKTSSIMLEQQTLMQEERFEATFYKLLERYEAAADAYLRKKPPKDKLTNGLRHLQSLRKKRAHFDALPLKICMRELKDHINAELKYDSVKKPLARAWKVFNFIDGSNLPHDRKKYYFSLFYDAMEPCEMVLLVTKAFVMRRTRKKFRVYSPGLLVKPQFFACIAISKYFGNRSGIPSA